VGQRRSAYLLGAWTDQPKSAIFTSPFMPSSRFSGLMSRWMTLRLCRYCRARAIWAIYKAARSSLKVPSLRRILYSSPLAAYSRIRYTRWGSPPARSAAPWWRNKCTRTRTLAS
jgi:hypothetical protein